jgi:hypothetical protein
LRVGCAAAVPDAPPDADDANDNSSRLYSAFVDHTTYNSPSPASCRLFAALLQFPMRRQTPLNIYVGHLRSGVEPSDALGKVLEGLQVGRCCAFGVISACCITTSCMLCSGVS